MRSMSFALTLSVSVLLGGVAKSQPVHSVGGLNVVDAHGRVLGQNLGDLDTPKVVFQVGERLFSVNVAPNGDLVGKCGSLCFELPGCSGAPFFLGCDGQVTPLVIFGPEKTVYLSSVGVVPQSITCQSAGYTYFDFGNQTTKQTCMEDYTEVMELVPAIPWADLASQFSAPFSVVPSDVDGSLCGDCNGDGRVVAGEFVQVIHNGFVSPP